MMEPTPRLIWELRQDKIRAARAMTEEQKLVAGADLFDVGCELMAAGIRMQHPGAASADVRRMLQGRLRMMWAREDR
jgi:hypothetical protein